MLAIVAHQAKDLRIEQREYAALPKSDEVRVRILLGGICGSDLHYYHNGGFGTVKLQEPMILGHEVSGEIIDVGSAVADLAVGDIVSINPSMPCNECKFCHAGMRNQCLNMRFCGSAMRFPHMQGLFREVITVPAEQVYKFPKGVDLGAAACAEPLAVCLHAAQQGPNLAGQTVLVSGCGPIGNLMIAVARDAGAQKIIATDIAEHALAIAKQMGAQITVNVATQPDGLAEYYADKGQVDIIFECTGNAQALDTALRVVRPDGCLINIGLGGALQFDSSLLVTKEITMRGSFRFDKEFAMAVDAIGSGRINISPLITNTVPAKEADAAFKLASERSRAMKVQLSFQDEY